MHFSPALSEPSPPFLSFTAVQGGVLGGAQSSLNVNVVAHQVTYSITHYQVPQANPNFVPKAEHRPTLP